MATKNQPDKTYYDVLGLPSTASQLDIKKAYRRLALIHHPDRNRAVAVDGDDNDKNRVGSKTSAKETFQMIGEAYHCLSDPVRRQQYDSELQSPFATTQSHGRDSEPYHQSNWAASNASSHAFVREGRRQWHPYPSPTSSVLFSDLMRRNNPHEAFFDAFEQFDSLFHQDPFFQEGFRDIDEEFARRFYNDDNSNKPKSSNDGAGTTSMTDVRRNTMENSGTDRHAVDGNRTIGMPSWLQKFIRPDNSSDPSPSSQEHVSKNKEGWIPWILRQLCGIDLEFQMTTVSSDGRGGVTTTNYYSSPSSDCQLSTDQRRRHRHLSCYKNSPPRRYDRIVPSSTTTSTYTKMSTSSYIDREGRRVTIQSKEVDGNRIEDKRIDNVLVQRKVNGVVVDIP